MILGLKRFVIFKIRKKSKLDWNELKLDIEHKNMYMYQKKYI